MANADLPFPPPRQAARAAQTAQKPATAADAHSHAHIVPLLPLGWLPALTLVAAICLFIVSTTLTGFNVSMQWAEPVFWLALLAYLIPCTIRLAMPGASRAERIGIVVLVGMSLYLVKTFLYSGYVFNFPDETQHYRTTIDMLATGRLFTHNPILPVSPSYPGMENVAVALIQLSGLSLHTSGILVIGVARLVTVLSLFFLYERISKSHRIAGLAVLFYASNPHFLLGNAMYAYESMSLPLMAFLLNAIVWKMQERLPDRLGIGIVIALALTGVIVTHHLSGLMLMLLLPFWAVVALIKREQGARTIVVAALMAIALFVVWAVFFAESVIPYIGYPIYNGVREAFQLLTGQRAARALFTSDANSDVPLWVRLSGFISVALVALAIAASLIPVWRRYKAQSIVVVMLVLGLAYPAAQAARFTPFGITVTYRSALFLYLGISFVVAAGVGAWLVRIYPREKPAGPVRQYAGLGVLTAGFIVILVGTYAAGFTSWKLPGPFQDGVLTRRIDVNSIQAALWVRDHFPPNERIGAEYDGQHVMGSYGGQRPLTVHEDNVWMEDSVFYTGGFGFSEKETLAGADVHYLVVDVRTQNTLTIRPSALIAPDPTRAVARTRLDAEPDADRIFDGGEIVIYDIRKVTP